MNTMKCSNTGFSLMIPKPCSKGRCQGQRLFCHSDESWRPGWPGCWDGTKQFFLIAVHSSINYCFQVPKHLPKVLFWLPCQAIKLLFPWVGGLGLRMPCQDSQL